MSVKYLHTLGFQALELTKATTESGDCGNVRYRRVRVQVDLLNLQYIILRVVAKVKRVVAWHLELFLDRDLAGDP